MLLGFSFLMLASICVTDMELFSRWRFLVPLLWLILFNRIIVFMNPYLNWLTSKSFPITDWLFNIYFVVTADIRVHEFFKTSYFKSGIHPIPGAHKALHKLSKFCNLSVVTYVPIREFIQKLEMTEIAVINLGLSDVLYRSRQNAIKDHTIEWIEKYYPGLFTEIHFGNHFALNGESRPKSDICRYA